MLRWRTMIKLTYLMAVVLSVLIGSLNLSVHADNGRGTGGILDGLQGGGNRTDNTGEDDNGSGIQQQDESQPEDGSLSEKAKIEGQIATLRPQIRQMQQAREQRSVSNQFPSIQQALAATQSYRNLLNHKRKLFQSQDWRSSWYGRRLRDQFIRTHQSLRDAEQQLENYVSGPGKIQTEAEKIAHMNWLLHRVYLEDKRLELLKLRIDKLPLEDEPFLELETNSITIKLTYPKKEDHVCGVGEADVKAKMTLTVRFRLDRYGHTDWVVGTFVESPFPSPEIDKSVEREVRQALEYEANRLLDTYLAGSKQIGFSNWQTLRKKGRLRINPVPELRYWSVEAEPPQIVVTVRRKESTDEEGSGE